MEDIDLLFINLNKSIDTAENEVKLLVSKYSFDCVSPEFDAMGYCCVCDFGRSAYYAKTLNDALRMSLLYCRREENSNLLNRVKTMIRLIEENFFNDIPLQDCNDNLLDSVPVFYFLASELATFDIEASPLTRFTPMPVREVIQDTICRDEDKGTEGNCGSLLSNVAAINTNLKNSSVRISVLLYLASLLLKASLQELVHVGDSRTDADYEHLFDIAYEKYKKEFNGIKEKYNKRYNSLRKSYDENNAKTIIEDETMGRLYNNVLGAIWDQTSYNKSKITRYICSQDYRNSGEISSFFFALLEYDYACKQSGVDYNDNSLTPPNNSMSREDAIREAINATMGIMENGKYLIQNKRQWLGIYRVLVDYKCIEEGKWTVFQKYIDSIYTERQKPRKELDALDLGEVYYTKPFNKPLCEWKVNDYKSSKANTYLQHEKIAKTFKEELDKRYNFG